MGIGKFKDYCVRRDASKIRDLKEAENPKKEAPPEDDAATAADKILRKHGFAGPLRRWSEPQEKPSRPLPTSFNAPSPGDDAPMPMSALEPPTPETPKKGKVKKDIYDRAIEKDGKSSRVEVDPETEEKIVQMAKKGWTPIAISLELPGQIPPGAVARVIKSRADAVPPAPFDPRNNSTNMGPENDADVRNFVQPKRGQPGYDPTVQKFGKPLGKRDKGIEDKHLN